MIFQKSLYYADLVSVTYQCFSQESWKEQQFKALEAFCNIINAFTVTFD